MKAIIYARTSTQKQDIQFQIESCVEFCNKLGLDVLETCQDSGKSGALPLEKRSGLQRALSMLNADTWLVCRGRDRLARDVRIARSIDEIVGAVGSRVLCVDYIQVAGILQDAANAMHPVQTSLSVRSAMSKMKQSGKRVGAIPYGFALSSDGLHLVANDYEQRLIQAMKSFREAGLTLRQIAAELGNAGFRSRSGKTFHTQQIIRAIEGAE
jgi:DNA invertase Pin-like site-specific DNA recombinase